MIGQNELIIIFLVVLVLFGGSRIPELARSIGKARGELERGMEEGKEEKKEGDR